MSRITKLEGEDLDTGVTLDISGVQVKFCHLVTPTKGRYGEEWSLALVLTPEEAAWFKKLGKKLYEDKDAEKNPTGMWLLNLRQKTRTADGRTMKPPVYVGMDGVTKMTEEMGNGSIASVRIRVKKTDQGIPIYIQGIQCIWYKEPVTVQFTDYTKEPEKLKELGLNPGEVQPAPEAAGTPAIPDAMDAPDAEGAAEVDDVTIPF